MSKKVENAVFEYMKQQNRPYSALDVFQNLHKEHGQTAVKKALEVLAEQHKLLEKVYGKSKIYVVHQSQFPAVGDAEIAKLDAEIKSLQSKIESIAAEAQATSKELRVLSAEPPTASALTEVENLRYEHGKCVAKLEKVSRGGVKIDPAQKQTVAKRHDEMQGQLRKRKRYTKDLMNAVLEGYPKSKKQFVEEVGLELDE